MLGDRIEIELAVRRRAEGLMQHVQNRLLPGIQRFVALALLLEADHDVVLRAGVQDRVADGLNGAVGQPSRRPIPCESGRPARGPANRTYTSVPPRKSIPYRNASVLKDRGPAGDAAESAESGDKILRLAHPIDVYVVKEFHSDTYPPLFDTVTAVMFPIEPFPPFHLEAATR